jgi:hypothetical protein
MPQEINHAVELIISHAKRPLIPREVLAILKKKYGFDENITEEVVETILSRTPTISPCSAYFHVKNGGVKLRADILELNQYFNQSGKRWTICIEGNIGVGKTTLCNRISSKFPEITTVYRERVNSELLKLMYKKGKQNAFPFQIYMLCQRQFSFELDQKTKNSVPPIRLHDRSLIGDAIFSTVNAIFGNIDEEQFLVYRSIILSDIFQLPNTIVNDKNAIKAVKNDPQCLLKEIAKYVSLPEHFQIWYLDDDPLNCKTRVETVRKISAENAIPLEYYECIKNVHDYAMHEFDVHHPGSVKRFKFPNYDLAENCLMN